MSDSEGELSVRVSNKVEKERVKPAKQAPPAKDSTGVSKKERLTRRFPGVRFLSRTPPGAVLFCCLVKLRLTAPSRRGEKETGWLVGGKRGKGAKRRSDDLRRLG